jgi:hypothetical protein
MLKKIKLPENLYTEEQLITAKQILQNSPLNAIFLSFGDNDYYPLYYLQSVKNLRKDVYVINYNLIGIDRYIYRATMPVNSALSIRLTADSNLYKEDTNNFILFEDSPNAIPFSDVIRLLKSGKKDYNGFITLKADKIVISEKKSNISATKEIPMRGVQYIYKNQWILLDIINNLNGRKMCFLNEFADQLKGLNDHFIFDNGLYILE